MRFDVSPILGHCLQGCASMNDWCFKRAGAKALHFSSIQGLCFLSVSSIAPLVENLAICLVAVDGALTTVRVAVLLGALLNTMSL